VSGGGGGGGERVWVWVRVWVCSVVRHGPAPAPAPTTAGRSERGAVAQCTSTHEHSTWALDPLVDACALQSIPEGAVARVPGICERFNGLRDPSMTPTMPEQSPTLARLWQFCDYLMLQPGSNYPKVC
jgi:hypothetical protein